MSSSADSPFTKQKVILYTCFFLSGFSGLLYQVIWLRLAYASFGIVMPVLSVVVSVFMIGLAGGAMLSGKLATFMSKKLSVPALQLYGICELLIGLLAISVPGLFQLTRTSLLAAGSVNSFSYMGLSAIAILLTLLPCCILMGCTYPLMLAHLRQVSPEGGDSFSFLYWANVSGAALGVVCSAFVLIELLGFKHCLLVGCAFNVIAAVLSLALSRRLHIANLEQSCDKIVEKESHVKVATPIVILLFMTGFISLAYEVVWTRVFMPALGTGIYAFAIILFVYLQSTAMGSRRYLATKNGNAGTKVESVLAALSIAALLPVVLNGQEPSLGISSVSVLEWQVRAIVAAFSIAPFCFYLGYLTPLLIDKGANGLPQATGRLYAINSVACIVGPLVASYVLLPLLGGRLSELLLALPFVVAVVWFAYRQRSKFMLAAAATSLALLVLGYTVCGSYDEPRLPGEKIYRDFAATVVAAVQGKDCSLMVNGQEMTARVPFLKMMAHFPVVLHDGPVKSSLVICLGMGTTFRSLLSWHHDTHAVELASGVKSACVYFYPDLHDKTDKIIVDDGRRYLECTKQKFDIITIDPPPPLEAAGSSLLYSREFCQLLKQHLNYGGLIQQFFPTDEKIVLASVARALSETFPYVRVFRSSDGWGYHFIASVQPINVPSLGEIEKRLTPQVIADLLENPEDRDRGKPLNQFRRLIYFEIPFKQVIDSNPSHVITDDRAINEYCLIRRLLLANPDEWKKTQVKLMPD